MPRLNDYTIPVSSGVAAVRLEKEPDGVHVLDSQGRTAHAIPWSWFERPKSKEELAEELVIYLGAHFHAIQGCGLSPMSRESKDLADLLVAWRDAE